MQTNGEKNKKIMYEPWNIFIELQHTNWSLRGPGSFSVESVDEMNGKLWTTLSLVSKFSVPLVV